jgi:hypothetical protein
VQEVRELDKKKVKTVGIYFGHQAIAQALGGQVARNPKVLFYCAMLWSMLSVCCYDARPWLVGVKACFASGFSPFLMVLCVHAGPRGVCEASSGYEGWREGLLSPL